MLSTRCVVIAVGCAGAIFSCAEAEEQRAPREGGQARGGLNAVAGNSASGGTISPQGGQVSSGGVAGRAGAESGGRAGSEIEGAGKSAGGTGGSAGGASGGGRAGTGAAGSGTAGSSSAGTGATGAGCVLDAAAGAGTLGDAGAAGGAAVAVFSDDFESGVATRWLPTLGTWAITSDGSQVYEQSLLENKLQVAIAQEVCLADQVLAARVKISDFGGASSSYSAALFGRVVSASTHYLLALGSDKKLALRKRVNASGTSATAIGSSASLTFVPGTWYDVHFEIIGTSLRGCVGDVCVTGSDSSIASGSVAVGTVNTTARFDDVRISAP
jgi:hypothetical protein